MEPADEDLGPLTRALGDLLAAHRSAAGLTQRELGHAVAYARVTVAGAETGSRVPAAAFWHRCDALLTAGGDLIRAYQQLVAARQARSNRAAARDQAERATRARTRRLGLTAAAGSRQPTEHIDTFSGTAQQLLPVGPATGEGDPASHGSAVLMENGCAEWLAWHLWQYGHDEIDVSQLPAPMVRYLNIGDGHPAAQVLSPGGLIVCTPDGRVSFVRLSDGDLFVGRRVFRDIAGGSSRLLGAGQTTHRTDLVVQQYVSQHDASILALGEWAKESTDALVRVNSGGILAKLGRDDLVDEVVVSLREHQGARLLYLTAVLNRVLNRPWSEAGSLAARIEDSEVLAVALSSDDLGRMAAEVGNADDGVARWCSAVVIGACGAPSGPIRLSLQHALRTERSRENLRTLGTVLSGAGPLAS